MCCLRGEFGTIVVKRSFVVPSLPSSCETFVSTLLLSLRARSESCWYVGEGAEWSRRRFAGASRRRAEADGRRACGGRGCAGPGAGRASGQEAVSGRVQVAGAARGRRLHEAG